MTPQEKLFDPNTLTMSMSEAAIVLGVCKSTASHAYLRTGYLTEGVRVIRVGKRCIVSCADLRKALGMEPR